MKILQIYYAGAVTYKTTGPTDGFCLNHFYLPALILFCNAQR